MVQHRISIHHRNSAARLAVVTIPIKLDWVNEVRLITIEIRCSIANILC